MEAKEILIKGRAPWKIAEGSEGEVLKEITLKISHKSDLMQETKMVTTQASSHGWMGLLPA